MKESDVKELEQLHAERAVDETIIQSLTDEVIELKEELRRVKAQARNVCCDED